MVGDHLHAFGHEDLVNSGGHVDWGTVSKCRNQSWDISGMDGFTPADVVQAGDCLCSKESKDHLLGSYWLWLWPLLGRADLFSPMAWPASLFRRVWKGTPDLSIITVSRIAANEAVIGAAAVHLVRFLCFGHQFGDPVADFFSPDLQ
jgi:hypothetical protein